jgi:hypothetical protein
MRSIAEAVEVIAAAEPERGDPAEALQRVLIVAWRYLERYHALVAINVQLPQAELRRRHQPVLALLQPLIERGQRAGTFRSDLPRSGTPRCCSPSSTPPAANCKPNGLPQLRSNRRW